MAHHLFASFSHFFHVYGYWTVFGVTLLEGAGIPLPGETLLLFAGFMARTGSIHLGWAIAGAIAGSTLGECVGYFIGELGGKAFLEGYRKRLRVSSSLYDRAQAGFLKNFPPLFFSFGSGIEPCRKTALGAVGDDNFGMGNGLGYICFAGT